MRPMANIFLGRYAADIQGSFVVFLIGMRINRLWRVPDWWSVAVAMAPMLRELYKHPEKGFLGAELFFSFSNWAPMVVQYWKTFDDLDRFARNQDDPHLPAWRDFNRKAARTGSVGIWHETYPVAAGRYEAVYGNMPRFGLAKAAGHVTATSRGETARTRLGGESKPAVEITY